MRRRQFLHGGLWASAAALVAPACVTHPGRRGEDDDGGHPLAGLRDMKGDPMTPPVLSGRVVILDFWASWCVPCRQAFRHMDQLYRTYQGDGLVVLAVSIDDDVAQARRFWSAARPRFAVAWDGSGAIRARFSVLTLPTTVLFDVDGEVVQRTEGFDLGEHRILEEQVHRLLRT